MSDTACLEGTYLSISRSVVHIFHWNFLYCWLPSSIYIGKKKITKSVLISWRIFVQSKKIYCILGRCHPMWKYLPMKNPIEMPYFWFTPNKKYLPILYFCVWLFLCEFGTCGYMCIYRAYQDPAKIICTVIDSAKEDVILVVLVMFNKNIKRFCYHTTSSLWIFTLKLKTCIDPATTHHTAQCILRRISCHKDTSYGFRYLSYFTLHDATDCGDVYGNMVIIA